jgi:hypothetical protein
LAFFWLGNQSWLLPAFSRLRGAKMNLSGFATGFLFGTKPRERFSATRSGNHGRIERRLKEGAEKVSGRVTPEHLRSSLFYAR